MVMMMVMMLMVDENQLRGRFRNDACSRLGLKMMMRQSKVRRMLKIGPTEDDDETESVEKPYQLLYQEVT